MLGSTVTFIKSAEYTLGFELEVWSSKSRYEYEASWITADVEATIRIVQMTCLQKMAMDVFIPSWGEINVSLAAAVLFILLMSYFQHFLTGNETSKDSVEENVVQLPAIPELEGVVVNDPSAQAVAKVRTEKLRRLLTLNASCTWECVWIASWCMIFCIFIFNVLQFDERWMQRDLL